MAGQETLSLKLICLSSDGYGVVQCGDDWYHIRPPYGIDTIDPIGAIEAGHMLANDHWDMTLDLNFDSWQSLYNQARVLLLPFRDGNDQKRACLAILANLSKPEIMDFIPRVLAETKDIHGGMAALAAFICSDAARGSIELTNKIIDAMVSLISQKHLDNNEN